jgi:hypothetical protein
LGNRRGPGGKRDRRGLVKRKPARGCSAATRFGRDAARGYTERCRKRRRVVVIVKTMMPSQIRPKLMA